MSHSELEEVTERAKFDDFTDRVVGFVVPAVFWCTLSALLTEAVLTWARVL